MAPICLLPGADGPSMTLHLAKKNILWTLSYSCRVLVRLCVKGQTRHRMSLTFFKAFSILCPHEVCLILTNVSVVTESSVCFWLLVGWYMKCNYVFRLSALLCVFSLLFIFNWLIICLWCSFVYFCTCAIHVMSQSTNDIYVMTLFLNQHQFLSEALQWRAQTDPDHVLYVLLNAKVD